MNNSKLVRDFAKAIEDKGRNKTSSFDAVATVRRVEGSTAWVHIAGGVDETPVQRTIDCRPGDTVQIRVGNGGTAWITGNGTAPPTDDTYARTVFYNLSENISSSNKFIEQLYETVQKIDITQAENIQGTWTEYCLASARAIPAGGTFEDIRVTDWSTTRPQYAENRYFWKRLVIEYVDGTILHCNPEFDMEWQIATEAAIAAGEANDALEEARQILDSSSDSFPDAIEAAQEAVEQLQELADSTNYHFWYDENGAHVSNREDHDLTRDDSISVGAAGTILRRNGYVAMGLTDGALSFYDETGTSPSLDDLLAVYSRNGTVFYNRNSNAANTRAMTIKSDAITMWDSSDISHAGTTSQRKKAVYGANGVELYDENGLKGLQVSSGGIVMQHDGELIGSWTKSALNFYTLSSANPATSIPLASYARSGITHYVDGNRSMSLTDSGLAFYDPSDSATDSTQRKQAIFGADGAELYAVVTDEQTGTVTNPKIADLKAGGLTLYDGSAAENDVAYFGPGEIRLGRTGPARINARMVEDAGARSGFELLHNGSPFAGIYAGTAPTSGTPVTSLHITSGDVSGHDADIYMGASHVLLRMAHEYNNTTYSASMEILPGADGTTERGTILLTCDELTVDAPVTSRYCNAMVNGSVTGGSGASSLTFTDAHCKGKSAIVCTAMDENCGILSATFTDKTSGTNKSSNGKIVVNFDRTLTNNTTINYVAW